MNRFIFIITLFLSIYAAQNVSAKGVIFYSTGDHIEVVKELPEDMKIGKDHVNIGVAYEQFSIFWLPLWNSGEPQYVLVTDDEKNYYSLDAEQAKGLIEEFDLPQNPKPSFWNQVGLKPIAIFIILLIIWSYYDDYKEKKRAKSIAEEEGKTIS